MKKLEAIKEARKVKKIQKLGAVSIKDFEALKQDVTLQRYGFIAIAGIEVIRLAMPKKKTLTQEDVDNIANKVVENICKDSESEEIPKNEDTPKNGGVENADEN